MDIRCQQFTSYNISENMLDMINYNSNLYGKKILENSCGEGNILALVVKRYILSGLAENRSLINIKQGLERDIYGVEIVKNTYNICIRNLDKMASKFGIENISWNVINQDVLTNPFKICFDYIVGNPPYISYKNLEPEIRTYIKENYITCKKGKPDYCYAFIENAIKYLGKQGKMAYLIPSSIFKNVFGSDLRLLISPFLTAIYDYPNCKLFDNALTSSSIMILDKATKESEFYYLNMAQQTELRLPKNKLKEKWIFKSDTDTDKNTFVKFKDFFKASITIATQRNKVFVINKEERDEYGIERGILRKAISPRNQNCESKEYIIFPYSVKKGELHKYTEEQIKEKYPNAYRYLEKNKTELEKRDADINSNWFEYGRSQAIHNMNRKKLLISTVVTNRVKTYLLGERTVPYSGIYIISENGYDLCIAKKILESERFLEYVTGIGTPASGSSLRVTAKDINEFVFKKDEFLG